MWVVRWTTIAAAMVLFIASGHLWNVQKVTPITLAVFDFMITLLTLFIVAMMMSDVDEKRKNVNALLLLIAGFLSLAFVVG